jgi:hypothetical protein
MSRELTYAQAIQEALAQAMEADERNVFPDGRGHWCLRRRLPGDRRSGASLRRGPRAWTRRLPNWVRRWRRSRCRRCRMQAGAGIPVLGFRHAGHGADRQSGGEDALHARWQGECAAGHALSGRFRHGCRGPALAIDRCLAGARAGAQGRPAVDAAGHAKGMLLAAIDDPDPVMVFEHKLLYKTKGEVPEEAYRVPIGKAHVAREGKHVTVVVATSIMVHKSLEAAEDARRRGHRCRSDRPAHVAPDGHRDDHRERQEDVAVWPASTKA